MTAFREGDIVVPHVPPMAGSEVVVLEVGTNGMVRHGIGISSTWRPTDDLMLVRRPLRVGDVVRYSGGCHPHVRNTVASLEPTDRDCRVKYISGGFDWATTLEHADGTPLDMPNRPKYTLKAAGGPLLVDGKQLQGYTIGIDAGGQDRTAIARVEVKLPTLEDLARTLARVLDDNFRDFVAERSECGDEAGPFEGGAQRHDRTWEIAWERDELGARTKWTDVARRTRNLLAAGVPRPPHPTHTEER